MSTISGDAVAATRSGAQDDLRQQRKVGYPGEGEPFAGVAGGSVHQYSLHPERGGGGSVVNQTVSDKPTILRSHVKGLRTQ